MKKNGMPDKIEWIIYMLGWLVLIAIIAMMLKHGVMARLFGG